jgi:hypothetical protein
MNFRKIKKITFALTLALGFTGAPGLSSLSTVQAQEPRPKVQEPRPTVQEPRPMSREQLERRVTMEQRSAFREGYRKGWQDSRSGRSFNYNRSRLYQMGDREYRDIYRKGYTRGYHRERVR